MSSRSRRFAKFLSSVNASGNISTESLGGDIEVGKISAVTSVSDFPENPLVGDIAFASESNEIYIRGSNAWYNIATINTTPTITSEADASYALSSDGTPTVVTLSATDPEGVPITWSHTVTSGVLGETTITNVDNVFTITPSTNEADVGSFGVSFIASDGVNSAVSSSSFTLQFAIDWSTISEQAKIYPANHGDGDTFGESIDIDGDIAVVGAVGDDGEGNSYLSAGAAYVYTRSGSTWTEQALLRPSDISGGESFGHKVCVDGNTIAVSAPFKTVSGQTFAGAVYIYTTADNGATWTEQQKIVASNPGGADYFGFGLGLSGDLLVASAHAEDTYGSNAGSAYVFKRTGATWAQQQQLGGADTVGNDQFGFSVAISNDTIAIGARNEDNDLVATVSNCGAVYVFTTSDNGSTWTQQDKFVSSTPTSTEQFGSAVDIHGDTIVVGAYQSNSQRGAGWIFTRSGSTWTQRVKLTPSVAVGAYFGEQVAIDKENGNVVVIGAPREHISGLADVGCAFVYSTADGGLTWTEDKKITSSDGVANDFFGSSVGINGNTVMVGATHDDTPENYAGAAYIFTAQ